MPELQTVVAGYLRRKDARRIMAMGDMRDRVERKAEQQACEHDSQPGGTITERSE